MKKPQSTDLTHQFPDTISQSKITFHIRRDFTEKRELPAAVASLILKSWAGEKIHSP